MIFRLPHRSFYQGQVNNEARVATIPVKYGLYPQGELPLRVF
ncbi:MAG: hypothetical protein U1E99_11160 [Agitococcus sp.]